ncbi:hypothetical protein A7Q09_05310 [Methylacidiphilum sp. Yel]|jgi:prevent-host-death family protein|uniref:type II toxin-antitoxin system Phd/YefM family antitoxin n=1 Tax=Methylacidiphilum sp. Yel TaxID=1847730 RepID=UPI00106BDEB6|nr:type II toxin-antitoxin system prevent-host-death family antitoxin [Methylacidiphilum sp. Yel]TFE69310.1 hypothetical protein A7Q09_05310 [Methylacidiphilum sp. Yel]
MEGIKIMTAKELKNKTGSALRYVAKGGKILITLRGKPIAIISPPNLEGSLQQPLLRSFEEAWRDIEETLEKTEPFFINWKEAESWSRRKEKKR